jgi:hypothetical protein
MRKLSHTIHNSATIQKISQFRPCILTNNISRNFAIDTRLFSSSFHRKRGIHFQCWNFKRSTKERHRRQLMETNRRSRVAVKPMHLAFSFAWPELSSDIRNQRDVLIIAHLQPVRDPNKLAPLIAHLRVTQGFGTNCWTDFRWFLWFCGALLAISWWRMTVPF